MIVTIVSKLVYFTLLTGRIQPTIILGWKNPSTGSTSRTSQWWMEILKGPLVFPFDRGKSRHFKSCQQPKFRQRKDCSGGGGSVQQTIGRWSSPNQNHIDARRERAFHGLGETICWGMLQPDSNCHNPTGSTTTWRSYEECGQDWEGFWQTCCHVETTAKTARTNSGMWELHVWSAWRNVSQWFRL